MVTNQIFFRLVVLVILLFIIGVQPPTLAVEQLGNSTVDQTATLTGPREQAPIPLYLRPAANQPNVGYGISGDPVTVLEQLASFLPEADPNTTWNHVRLNTEPYTEGWVQGKFLSMDKVSKDSF